MRNVTSRWIKCCIGAVVLGAMLIVGSGMMPGTAQAGTRMNYVTCTSGTPCPTVIVGGPPTFVPGPFTSNAGGESINNGTPISVSTLDQVIPFKFTTSITDLRGNGVGWTVSGSATAYTFGGTTPTVTADLFLNASNPVVITCAGGSNCSSPAAIATPTGGDNLVPGPVSLATAGTAAGIGAFSILTNGNFTVPGSVPVNAITGGTISVTTTPSL